MSNFREQIKDELLRKRDLGHSTLQTYVSILFNLIKKNDLIEKLDTFENDKENIINIIKKNKSAQTRKTSYSGLYVLTNLPEYAEEMKKDIKIVNESYKNKEMSPERKAMMKSREQIKAINDSLIDIYKNEKSNENLNNVIITTFQSGVYIPPRRLELSSIKTKDYDKITDNYILKDKIYLNNYKTSKKYGQQIIEIPKKILLFYKKAIDTNISGYLLQTKNKKAYSASSYSKKLHQMFGMGADLLRSSYINDVLYKDGLYEKFEQQATQMGNSIEAQMDFYIKKK
tara:strand:- start:240 stop:1097 length:858 start_codon:yes stop_codon:yes gene_type:complete